MSFPAIGSQLEEKPKKARFGEKPNAMEFGLKPMSLIELQKQPKSKLRADPNDLGWMRDINLLFGRRIRVCHVQVGKFSYEYNCIDWLIGEVYDVSLISSDDGTELVSTCGKINLVRIESGHFNFGVNSMYRARVRPCGALMSEKYLAWVPASELRKAAKLAMKNGELALTFSTDKNREELRKIIKDLNASIDSAVRRLVALDDDLE